jgi:hypothetical protein
MTFTPETVIAFSATFVALLSLFISFWQLKGQRRLNRNAFRPLPWFYIRNGDDEFFVDLYNDGPGPRSSTIKMSMTKFIPTKGVLPF